MIAEGFNTYKKHISLNQELANYFFLQTQILNLFWLSNTIISMETSQFYCCSEKAATKKTHKKTNKSEGCAQVKLSELGLVQ